MHVDSSSSSSNEPVVRFIRSFVDSLIHSFIHSFSCATVGSREIPGGGGRALGPRGDVFVPARERIWKSSSSSFEFLFVWCLSVPLRELCRCMFFSHAKREKDRKSLSWRETGINVSFAPPQTTSPTQFRPPSQPTGDKNDNERVGKQTTVLCREPRLAEQI